MLIYCKAYDFPNVSFESKSIQVDKSSINIEGGIIEFAGVKKKLKLKPGQLNSLDNNLFAIEGEFEILYYLNLMLKDLVFCLLKIEDLVKIQYSIKGVHNE